MKNDGGGENGKILSDGQIERKREREVRDSRHDDDVEGSRNGTRGRRENV